MPTPTEALGKAKEYVIKDDDGLAAYGLCIFGNYSGTFDQEAARERQYVETLKKVAQAFAAFAAEREAKAWEEAAEKVRKAGLEALVLFDEFRARAAIKETQ